MHGTGVREMVYWGGELGGLGVSNVGHSSSEHYRSQSYKTIMVILTIILRWMSNPFIT